MSRSHSNIWYSANSRVVDDLRYDSSNPRFDGRFLYKNSLRELREGPLKIMLPEEFRLGKSGKGCAQKRRVEVPCKDCGEIVERATVRIARCFPCKKIYRRKQSLLYSEKRKLSAIVSGCG